MHVTKLIAETDERGSISWVWLMAGRDRFARPADPDGIDPRLDLGQAQIHGAPAREVKAWIAARTRKDDAGRRP